jgi:hypothetical protein
LEAIKIWKAARLSLIKGVIFDDQDDRADHVATLERIIKVVSQHLDTRKEQQKTLRVLREELSRGW